RERRQCRAARTGARDARGHHLFPGRRQVCGGRAPARTGLLPGRLARRLEMMSGAWGEVVSLLEHAVGAGRVSPAAALLVARGDRILFEHCTGVAGPNGDEHSCDNETVFDVASLTKPLVTGAV